MLKFNDNNIYVGYIKQLLKSFNLPTCPLEKKDFKQTIHYIDNNALYQNIWNDNNSTSTQTKIRSYKRDDYIESITKNLEIKSNIFDSYTQEYLGDYLRYLRDYDNLDLMSMYNCFSNISTSNFDFKLQDNKLVALDSQSSDYTIFAIPIKFNREYTIAIEWHGVIEMCCGFYSNKRLYESNLNKGTKLFSYKKVSGCRFSFPFVYNGLVSEDKTIREDYINEKNLKLFLKIPTTCKSSIVVLEGNYLEDASFTREQVDRRKIILTRDWEEFGEDLKCLSKNQLLASNDGNVYFIADRLKEYLSNQVITQLDPVENNIVRLQRKAYEENDVPYGYLGVFDENLRRFMYGLNIDTGNIYKYYDVLGYYDKDIEQQYNIDYIITGYTKDEKGKVKAIKKENGEWTAQY